MSGMIPKILTIAFGTAAGFFLLSIVRPKTRQRIIDVVAVAGIGYVIFFNATKQAATSPPSEFVKAVNLEPIATLAVQEEGRLKSFDSLARKMMRYVSGANRIAGQEPVFTYLDMLLRPQAYENADVIYVKNKPIRKTISDRLATMNAADPSVLETFTKTGLIAPTLLKLPFVSALLDDLEKDLMRTARPVNEIQSALTVSDPRVLLQNMRIIPPPAGTPQDRWHLAQDVIAAAPQDDMHSGMQRPKGIPGLDPQMAAQLTQSWSELAAAWDGQDAAAANDKIARFASAVRSVAPSLYPDLEKLKLENWYFRAKGMTWNWIVYALAVIPLLMSVIYRWNGARMAGMVMFLVAFALHTTSMGIRWHISGRIPNSNMFEAITAATWFGCVGSFVIEFLTRKTAMRSLFFLGAAVSAMVASMCAHFMPTTLSADIENIMPILHDVWLYIHTNMIIWSYCLIAMASISALLYLRHRVGGGSPDAAVLGGAGSLIMTGKRSFISGGAVSFAQVLDGATMVLMELSFVTLWTGLVMGAIWADHSWGRPWGWDPKEVFALNTFIIFLLLVHVRVKVKDKGLWTAILAAAGCGVMLFNWIVINFVITGLHSYA